MGRGETPIREQLLREGWGAAYQEGHGLPFEEVADLALTMLADLSQTLTLAGTVAQEPTQGFPEQVPVESLLSEREQEVLRLVAEGLTSKAIGQRIFLYR